MANKFLYENEDLKLPSCCNCMNKYDDLAACEAFPIGIPDKILNGMNKHTKPYPGQENDIVFEPIK